MAGNRNLNAAKNAAKNGITNARFLCGDAAEAARQLEREHSMLRRSY